MGTNFKSFSKELEAMKGQIQEEVSDVIKNIVIDLVEALLRPKQDGGAPKLTGWLRANFLLSLNTAKSGPVGSQKSVSKAQRDNLVQRFKSLKPETLLAAHSIIINNEVPYGSIVNNGSENQSPQNFMEKAIEKLKDDIRSQRIIK